MGSSILEFMRGPLWGEFKSYLHYAESHRSRHSLSQSSINTYHSSIKMFLLTYLRDETIDALWNGHLDAIIDLERTYGNNANFSMQQCAFRHFLLFMEPYRPDVLLPFTRCRDCLQPNIPHTCLGLIRCFGKCSKLVPRVKLSESGICEYCTEKYPMIYSETSRRTRRRSRYMEYVTDHALIGREYEPLKHDRMIRAYIIEALRWHADSESLRSESSPDA